jgi:hypothetical protein
MAALQRTYGGLVPPAQLIGGGVTLESQADPRRRCVTLQTVSRPPTRQEIQARLLFLFGIFKFM